MSQEGECIFWEGETSFEGHIVRVLEITCPNGYHGLIHVTKEPAFSLNYSGGQHNVWHYALDGDRITLTGVGNNSVKFVGYDGAEICHVTVTDWKVSERKL